VLFGVEGAHTRGGPGAVAGLGDIPLEWHRVRGQPGQHRLLSHEAILRLVALYWSSGTTTWTETALYSPEVVATSEKGVRRRTNENEVISDAIDREVVISYTTRQDAVPGPCADMQPSWMADGLSVPRPTLLASVAASAPREVRDCERHHRPPGPGT
jgi:hypothetical protein